MPPRHSRAAAGPLQAHARPTADAEKGRARWTGSGSSAFAILSLRLRRLTRFLHGYGAELEAEAS
jgi:hypothetical protein